MKMTRYAINFSYIGTHYKGSQRRCNKALMDIDTVQGAIESSFQKIKRFKAPSLIMAGRTDAGVHALCSTAHFDLEKPIDTQYFIRESNKFLLGCGHQIRLLSCYEVSSNFHARFSAISRTYVYRFLMANDPTFSQIPISEYSRTLHLRSNPHKFDFERMRRGLDLFRGTHDFKSFSAPSTNKIEYERRRTYVRSLNIELEPAQPLLPVDPLSKHFSYWNFIFTSKSYLYHQIRRIVGTLFALGLNKISEEEIMTMLQVPGHHNWNRSIDPALPHGLYLFGIKYDGKDIEST
ncbi:tRNA pseudouridine synthase-like 1 [Trichogramma pretiosum]|uniref:tRNA pseudouridine synthase-like 1 n=1 Tax=Trichogramma pretiosum TaxID=7493 RepID=UPI0006C99E25|nr:tRNA pseudouridine synthase-like 1 [Trichogramma pretiosum]